MGASILKPYGRLLVPFFLAACLVVGYWFYWNKAAREIEMRARAAIPVGAASSVNVTGFPYRLTIKIVDVNFVAPNGSAFKASSVVATATPFNPMLWVLEGSYDPALALPGGPLMPLKATNLKSSVRLQASGLERFSLTFDGLQALGNGGWSIGKGLFHIMSRFEDDVSLAMVLDLSDVKTSKPLDGPGAILGDTVKHIFVSGPINQRQALNSSTKDWRDAGGKFTIMAGEVIWGPVYLTEARGELSLGRNDKWQGTISGQGALRPDGMPVSGLSGPIKLDIRDSELYLSGLPGIVLSNALR